MDFKQFEYIIKVAEIRNITKAAQELYISQPSLSHFITKVEKELGETLFDRSTNPLTLTLAGEKYVETGRQILEMNKDLKDEIFEISSKKKGRIKVGIPRTRATYMLPHFYSEFNRLYPNMEITTKETSADIVEENVLNGIVDFGIMPLPIYNKKLNRFLVYEKIAKEQLLLVVQKGYLNSDYLLKDDIIDISKFEDMPFILLTKGRAIRSAIDNMFKSHKIKPNILMETSSNATAFRLATTGAGASIVPSYLLNLYRGMEGFDVYRLSEEGIHWDVAFVYQKTDDKNQMRDDLVEILKNTFNNTYFE